MGANEPQLSEAVGSVQPALCKQTPGEVKWTMLAGQLTEGCWLSTTVMVKLQVMGPFPEESVAE